MSVKSDERRTNGHTHQVGSPSAMQEHVALGPPGAAEPAELEHERQLLAILPAMLFTSRPDGSWDYVNPQFCAYTGYAEEALTGLGWAATLHADDQADSLHSWQAGIKSGAPFRVEHRLRGADGAHRWFCTQYVPQRNPAGVITRWAGVAAPVESAHQIKIERALRRGAERALAERDSVIAIVAHELRTPLTVLLGQANLLQRRLQTRASAEPSDRRAVDSMVAQTLQLSRLMSALFDVAQLEHGQLLLSATTLDLSDLVRQVVQLLQPTLPAHTLRLSIDTMPLWVVGDPLRLEQVLQNLLQNAVKYSPRGGEVVIRVTPEGRHARIAVSDQGIGIAASVRPFLFQRFTRGQQRGGHSTPGLGIGLYICKTIMDLHGGSIEVESSEGAGCTMTLLLPQVQLEPESELASGGRP